MSAEECCEFLGRLVRRPVRSRYDPEVAWPLWPDATRMHGILGHCEVPWKEGMRRIAERSG